MNDRQRFLDTVRFREVDRYPYWEVRVWGQTYDGWLQEGVDEEKPRGDWFRGEPAFAVLRRTVSPNR